MSRRCAFQRLQIPLGWLASLQVRDTFVKNFLLHVRSLSGDADREARQTLCYNGVAKPSGRYWRQRGCAEERDAAA